MNKYNLQITKSWFRFKSYLVGISETLRETSLNNKDVKFNQWLSGLIDGNGYLNVTKSNNTSSLEIILPLKEIKTLEIIKQKFGGSIKLRSGNKSYRYRLHHKIGMINLINAINGNIRNSKRLIQLHNVCSILNLPIMKSELNHINNGWFIGYFDAEGIIEYKFINNTPKLTISVKNKSLIDIEIYQIYFGGELYYDKSNYGYYKWYIEDKNDILNFINYVKLHPSRTSKFNKLMLCKRYYELIELNAYMNDSLLNKAWLNFEKKWNS